MWLRRHSIWVFNWMTAIHIASRKGPEQSSRRSSSYRAHGPDETGKRFAGHRHGPYAAAFDRGTVTFADIAA
jgi:hypothetical protein